MDQEIIKIAAVIGAVLVILAFLKTASKKLATLFRKVIFVIQQEEIHRVIDGKLDSNDDKLDLIDKKVEKLMRAVLRNGGDSDSLGDSLGRVEEKLDVMEKTHEAELHHDPTPRVKANAAGHLTWANKAYILMTGFPLESMMGAGWVNSIHLDNRERVETSWMKAVEQQREFSDIQHFIRPDGTDYWKQVDCQPIIVGDQLRGYVVKFTDVESNGHQVVKSD